MADSSVSPEKTRQLQERMAGLGIREADIEEQFIHAQGRGGQKVNKTSACVRLRHLPTGIEVKCQETRSRAANRFFARRLLADLVEDTLLGKDSPRAREAERIRKQKKRRSRKVRQRSAAGREQS